MLEIILIIVIAKKIAAMMKEKGRSAVPFVILFVVLWVGGEITGAVIGTIMSFASDPNALNQDFNWMAYGMALLGAVIGGGLGFAIAAMIPAAEDFSHQEKLEEYDDHEKRRGYDDRDEDDDRPATPRRRRQDGSFEEHDDR